MKGTSLTSVLLSISTFSICGLVAQEQIPPHRVQQIVEAAPEQASAEPEQPRHILIWITPPHLMKDDPHKGYCIPYGTHALKVLGEKTGAYEPVVSGDLSMYLPENINQFDAIVMNNSSRNWITPTDEQMEEPAFKKHGDDKKSVEKVLRNSLLNYVREGGGIMALHYAIGANRHWPEFKQLLGAAYWGHPWNEEVGVTVEEPDHPLTAAFNGDEFRIADEIYQFREPYDRDQVRVLLSLDPERTNMGVKWIHRDDNDFALAWVKPYGRGRVFYTCFGHRTEIYWDPRVLRFYLDGIQFATGDLEAPAEPVATSDRAGNEAGFISLFNGKDLSGWEGDERIWSVQNGAITGRTTEEVRVKENNFLIWQGGKPRNFELRLKYKLNGGNSGIYFHAEKRPEGEEGEPLVGPQADFSADHRWTGVLMEYTKRDILAERGQRVRIDENGNKEVTGSVGDPDELLNAVNDDGWNDYRVVARGERVLLEINGVTMCEVIDKDPRRTPEGYLALQTHTGPPMTVQFKDIRLKEY